MKDFEKLIQEIKKFRDDRDWLQFHKPKEMAAAISIEAAELLEIFLWVNSDLSTECARRNRAQIEQEIADIAIYLLELADNLDIDLAKAIRDKLRLNAERYPVSKAKGKANKYNQL